MLRYPFAYAESFVYLFQGSPYNSWHKEASAGESLRSKLLYLSLFVRVFLCGRYYPLLFYCLQRFVTANTFCVLGDRDLTVNSVLDPHVDWRVVASDIGFFIASKFSENELKVDIDEKREC